MVKFSKTSVLSDWAMDISVNCPAQKFVEVLNLQVPAQQIIRWGGGSIIGGVDARETMVFNLNSAPNTLISGTVRIVVSDANKVVRNFVKEIRTEDLITGKGIKLGEILAVGAKQDSYLIVEFAADVTSTATLVDSTAFIPITIETL